MTTEAASQEQSPAAALTPRRGISRWTAFGTGVGIEIREKELQVTIVRVRPSEIGVLGAATVTDFRTRPAAEWGTELSAFLRKLAVGHVAATVLLPRRDVIVRAIHMPGVTDRDLEAAVRLQIDSLHPFSDEDVTFSFARIGATPYVLVGISRRSVIDTYSALFAEAGLKIAAFTFSAAIVFNALRVITAPPANFVSAHPAQNGIELYGESEGKPVYSALLPVAWDRAVGIARSELRLDVETPVAHLTELLPRPTLFPADYNPKSPHFEENILPYSTAVAGACPWLGIESNLLPTELRRTSSRVRLIPTIAFAVILSVLLVMLAMQQSWSDSRYLNVLQMQIRKYEPAVKQTEALDRRIASTRARSQSLDEFKRRARLDIDTLAEVTKLIPAPGWVNALDMDRATVQIGGEVDQAAPLLEKFDASPLFDRSEFSMPISRGPAGDIFRIKTQRTVPPINAPQQSPTPQKEAAKEPAKEQPKPASKEPSANPFAGGPRK